ncbi:FtsW/RodA/SpoVE family cell cycle protein [Bacteroidota bacterium]
MFELVKRYVKGDRIIWIVIITLSLISLLAVYSSTGTLAYKYQGGNTIYYFFKHAIFLFMGLLVIFITHLIPYKYYSWLSQVFLLITIPLLIFTLVMGTSLNQAARWVTIPGLGFTIQTSDFAKLALIMYIARVLSLKQDKVDNFKEAFIPIIVPVIIVCGLILPANFSTAAILFITSIIIMFVGRIKFKFLALLMLTGIICLGIFVGIALLVNSEGRIGTWKNRIEHYVSGDSEGNYQVEQAKIAITNGGILGKGPGNSMQRNYLPHPYSDFIYAIIIEEYGITGGVLVLFLYLYLLFRAGVIVRKSIRSFPAFLAIGLSISLVFQAMVNMGVAVNLFPVTGQTLPLVSMGGTSMLFTSIALGIILSISRSNQLQEEQESLEENENIENEEAA